MLQRYRMTAKCHNRIGQLVALIGLYPGLNTAATRKQH
jgi:hypothetical protein